MKTAKTPTTWKTGKYGYTEFYRNGKRVYDFIVICGNVASFKSTRENIVVPNFRGLNYKYV